MHSDEIKVNSSDMVTINSTTGRHVQIQELTIHMMGNSNYSCMTPTTFRLCHMTSLDVSSAT